MRYMGALDPTLKTQMLAQASTMNDADAAEFLSIAEATSYGKQKRLERYGVGAAAGLLVGLVASRLLRKRR